MEIDLVLVGASRREQIQMGPMGLTRRFVLADSASHWSLKPTNASYVGQAVLVLESGRAE